MNDTGQTLDIRAAVTRRPGASFVIEPVRLRAPTGDEVRVRIVATGLCHTDLIVRDQHYPVPLPAVLGHEGAGIVEAVGPAVHDLAVGDHVVLTYGHCGHCRHCAGGAPTYCTEFFERNFGGAGPDGGHALTDAQGIPLNDHFFSQSSLATYALCRATNAVAVRRDAPLALLGPLGCGIQSGAGAVLNALAVTSGSRVAVYGAGSVGLSAVMAARVAGASIIVVVDPIASRRALAKSLGATQVIDPAADVAEQVRQATAGGADFAVESSGRPAVLRQAVDALDKRGVAGIVGAPPLGTDVALDINDLLIGGKQVRGIVEGDSVPGTFIPQLIDLYMAGRFPFDRLLKAYDFDAIETAVADSESGVTLKPVLLMGDTPAEALGPLATASR